MSFRRVFLPRVKDMARKAAMSLERRALRAGQPVPWCKTIKFQTDPSVKMLSMELRAVPEAENRSSFRLECHEAQQLGAVSGA